MKASIPTLCLLALGVAPACLDSDPGADPSADPAADPATGELAAAGPVYGVDYSFARPSLSGLKSMGYSFVVRYFSHDPGKTMVKAEADAIIAAGMDVVSNWESTADSALGGYAQGVADAKDAKAEAAAAGAPADRPIYFSVDFDATEAQQVPINAYFDGVASVIGRDRAGAYGGYYVVKRLFDAGKIKWGWQTTAWSGGQWEPRLQLRQIQNSLLNGQVDKDQAMTADFGQWGHAPPMPPRGSLDGVTCSAATGWTQDPSAPTAANTARLYFDSQPGDTVVHEVAIPANVKRADLCGPLGSCTHGFQRTLPRALLDNGKHTVRAFGVAMVGGAVAALAHSPKTLTCSADLPKGVVRRPVSAAGFKAWKFDAYWDAMRPSAAQLAARGAGDPFPDAFACVRAPGAPAIYIPDGGAKRHLTSAASAAAWRISLATCKDVAPADLDAMPDGPDWPAAPVLAQQGGATFVLDDQGAGTVTGEGGTDPSDTTGGCNTGRGDVGVLALAALAGVLRRPRRARPA